MERRETLNSVVSVTWLAENLSLPGLVILDASLDPIGAPDSWNENEFLLGLPGARCFDFDTQICDRQSDLPHMLPTPNCFQHEVRTLGIDADSTIVVYDRVGVFSSPRAWWMFKAMGHDRVAVLDGGLPAWREAGLPLESLSEDPAPVGTFVHRYRPELVSGFNAVMAALRDPSYAVIDARSAGRFAGLEPEPRPGLPSGHMPNAANIPYSTVLSQGRFRPAHELREIFGARVTPDQRLIFTCGSGVTACILAMAAHLAGYSQWAVYDGSWYEWVKRNGPVVRNEGQNQSLNCEGVPPSLTSKVAQ